MEQRAIDVEYVWEEDLQEHLRNLSRTTTILALIPRGGETIMVVTEIEGAYRESE